MDYIEAAYALVDAGYCSESTYAGLLIGYIEQYGFDQLDSVTPDENGVFGMIMDRSRVEMATGDSTTLVATAYPAPQTEIEITWKSDRPDVASVDQNGNVTAHKQGYTLITATYNGKEACAVICVDSNAYVMNQNLYVYSEPGNTSTSIGRLLRGQPLRVNSETVYTAPNGTEYYAVSAGVGSGAPISGYAEKKHIAINTDARLSIGTPKTVYYQSVGDSVQIPLEIYADELMDKPFVWQSSMPDVVSVGEDGTFCALKEGVAVLSVQLDGKTALTVTVYVGEAAYPTLIANAAVYLRAGPTQGAKILGTIQKGMEVKLISEPQNGWYLVLAQIGGQTLQGYSYSRYFDFPIDTPPDVSDDESSDESSSDESASDESSSDETSADASSDETTSDETTSDDTSSDETSSNGTSSDETSSDETSSDDTSSDDTSSDDTSSDTSSEEEYIPVPHPAGKVNVDDALNVRDAAGMGGKKIARLLPSQQVILLGDIIIVDSEPTYKEWYHIRFTYEGAEMEGYVAAEFIIPDGTVDIPVKKPAPPVSNKFLMDALYVTDIPAGTTLQAFLETFDVQVRVFRIKSDAEVELTPEEVIATGDEMRLYLGDTLVYSYLLVVKGDVGGNGAIDAKDYMMTKRIVLGTFSVEGAPFRAAALDDEKIDVRDYMMIKRVALGTYTFRYSFESTGE